MLTMQDPEADQASVVFREWNNISTDLRPKLFNVYIGFQPCHEAGLASCSTELSLELQEIAWVTYGVRRRLADVRVRGFMSLVWLVDLRDNSRRWEDLNSHRTGEAIYPRPSTASSVR